MNFDETQRINFALILALFLYDLLGFIPPLWLNYKSCFGFGQGDNMMGIIEFPCEGYV